MFEGEELERCMASGTGFLRLCELVKRRRVDELAWFKAWGSSLQDVAIPKDLATVCLGFVSGGVSREVLQAARERWLPASVESAGPGEVGPSDAELAGLVGVLNSGGFSKAFWRSYLVSVGGVDVGLGAPPALLMWALRKVGVLQGWDFSWTVDRLREALQEISELSGFVGLASNPAAVLLNAFHNRPRKAKPFRPKGRALLPRWDRIVADDGSDLRGLPDVDEVPAGGQLNLPGFEPVVTDCPSWLLWLYDRAGRAPGNWGRGARWDMRLFVGAFLNLRLDERDGQWRSLRFPTDEVIQWLHPGGWGNRRRDWERLPAALASLRERLANIYVPGLGSVTMIWPSVVPVRPTDPLVEFTLRVPSVAARGASVDWPRLCAYGVESDVLYRALLSVSAFLDRSSHRGRPVTAQLEGKRGTAGAMVPNPARRYVKPLDGYDLARMIGLDPQNKRRRHEARRAFERLDSDGVIDFQGDGSGFRIFGPAGRAV